MLTVTQVIILVLQNCTIVHVIGWTLITLLVTAEFRGTPPPLSVYIRSERTGSRKQTSPTQDQLVLKVLVQLDF